jgi:hypothetical protein
VTALKASTTPQGDRERVFAVRRALTALGKLNKPLKGGKGRLGAIFIDWMNCGCSRGESFLLYFA